jgi:porphobilinogen synthase
MVRETELNPADFIYPLFVTHGRNVRNPIPSMPGISQLSVENAVVEAAEAAEMGIPAVILFGLPAEKDPVGLENFAPDGIVQQTTRALKTQLPNLVVVTDVCLCEYTDHGHCGLLNGGDGRLPHPSLPKGYVLNDETLEILDKVAVSHAEAGADIVAPSGMMDGMVNTIRQALDRDGYHHLPIMSYAVKYASSFYGPFREAADSAPAFGDRRGYQMDPANARMALDEVYTDIGEGADIVMVKPALPFLDVVRRVRDSVDVPVAAYNVSGEYAMLMAAIHNGWLDEERATNEVLTGIRRAGADIVITYHAKAWAARR